ncbi:MAG: hypothetical protein QM805_22515 [Pseudomonas sp.]
MRADNVARERDAVEAAVHAGEDLVEREQRRVDAEGHGALPEIAADDAEQLDPVAEIAGAADVLERHLADALDERVVLVDPFAVGEEGEYDGLVEGVDAVEVERLVGLDVAELARVLEDRLVRQAVLLHAGEDVVGRAVDDAADELEAVGDEAFADGLDDGDAAGDGGLEEEAAAVVLHGPEDLLAVLA